ncbi:hypothetical protein KJ966_31010 [bacterium]|nr:hypothetical protein [bacterium]
MKLLLRIGGILNLFLAIFHFMFWKLFDWPNSLSCLAETQQAIMQVLNIHLGLVVAFFGYVSLFFPDDLLNSKIGKQLLLLISFFYLVRVINEGVFFGISHPASIGTIIVLALVSLLYFAVWRSADLVKNQ